MKTVSDFLQKLIDSKLLTADQLSAAKYSATNSPVELAKVLVKQKLLTKWQAEQLLSGNAKLWLGKYKLLDKLGEGGMGAVYKAEQINLQRIVALKVMSEKVLQESDAASRFQREIRTVSALRHPNIVGAVDADVVDDQQFLVMEYMPGRDLKSYIKEYRQLKIDWSCEVIRQAALGLQHAWEKNIIHRDIKPSNILIIEDSPDAFPTAKVLDMGLAKFTAEVQNTVLTQTGQVLGTIDYIAPEQAKDTKNVDCRADIFSLGAALFHCLTGQVPFTGNSPVEKLMARAIRDAPRTRSLRADVPPALDAVIARMLARNPQDRFSTPAEVAQALAPFSLGFGSDSSGSLTVNMGVPNDSTLHSSSPVENEYFPSLQSATSHTFHEPAVPHVPLSLSPVSQPWVVFGGFGVLLLATVLLAWFLIRSSGTPTPVAQTPSQGSPSTNSFGEGGVWNPNPETMKPNPPTTPVVPPAVRPPPPPLPNPPPLVQHNNEVRQQLELLVQELKQANPGYDGTVRGFGTSNYKAITQLQLITDQISDLTPLQRLTSLQGLAIEGSYSKGKVVNLKPLSGLKLHELTLDHNLGITDLSPLKDMPLKKLSLRFTQVEDLAPLIGMNLEWLGIGNTGVRNLEPLRGMPLKRLTFGGWDSKISDLSPLTSAPLEHLGCESSAVADLSPLSNAPLSILWCQGSLITDLSIIRGKPLFDLSCNFSHWRDAELLRSVPTLKYINHKSVAQFWQEVDTERFAFESWIATVQKLPPDQQVAKVGEKLKALNPAFDLACLEHEIAENQVVTLKFRGATDISPVRALKGLKKLDCNWKYTGHVALTNLWPLRGMNLEDLKLYRTDVSDLRPLQGMPLRFLNAAYSKVEDLSALKGMPLENLTIYGCRVSDLRPLAGMNLQYLICFGCPISDISPLKNVKINSLQFDFSLWRDLELLETIPNLEWVNEKRKYQFISEVKAQRAAFDAWVAEVQQLPLHNQVTKVSEKLKALNPNFDGKFKHIIGQNCVVNVGFETAQITDISPLRVFSQLQRIYCPGGDPAGDGKLTDLWPLEGMKLTQFWCHHNQQLSDLRPLRGMPLNRLHIQMTKVSDLEPLRGMKLQVFDCANTKVSDLSPLTGMPINSFYCYKNRVTDLSLLADMPLTSLHYHPRTRADVEYLRGKPLVILDGVFNWQRDAEIIRSIKSLKQICREPSDRFWMAWDAAHPSSFSTSLTLQNSIGMQLRLIPAGKFLMGSPENEKGRREDEGPQHEVTLTQPFFMGVYEVTQGEYVHITGNNPAKFKDRPKRVVEQVSWDEAVMFCQKLSELPTEKQAGRKYRLPTEAEWEYACRAGTTTPFHFGNDVTSTHCNLRGNAPYGNADPGPVLWQTVLVGTYQPNAWGLHDMHGNVAEWCADFYDEKYYANSPSQNPAGPAQGEKHLQRGGAFNFGGEHCRSAYRMAYRGNSRHENVGFRVVCDVPSPAASATTIPAALLAENAWGRFTPGWFAKYQATVTVTGGPSRTEIFTLMMSDAQPTLWTIELTRFLAGQEISDTATYLKGQYAGLEKILSSSAPTDYQVRSVKQESIVTVGGRREVEVVELVRQHEGQTQSVTLWVHPKIPGAIIRRLEINHIAKIDLQLLEFGFQPTIPPAILK